ncbi:MAG: type II toxin-antitoxin system MqsA family antitoxin [Spirochaetales bacterium]|nr:type II toxin-antitoxin system MqsA family antitoxin [Spirochaetales bacterium]
MISIYKDSIKDALYPKKGVLTKTNKFIKINEPTAMEAKDVKELRKFLQLSQSLFAQVLGVSHKTVQAWEHGTNIPTGSALRLMNILKKYPDVLMETNIVEESLN